MIAEKELLRVGFSKFEEYYTIDVGTAKKKLRELWVGTIGAIYVEGEVGKEKKTVLYDVKERGELTAWMVNQIYFMFTGKELGLKGK